MMPPATARADTYKQRQEERSLKRDRKRPTRNRNPVGEKITTGCRSRLRRFDAALEAVSRCSHPPELVQ